MLCRDRAPRGALCLCMLALLAGCAGGSGTAPAQPDTAPPAAAQAEAGPVSQPGQAEPAPAPQAVRPNTPTVYEPQSPGTSVLGAKPLRVDVSNAAQGYVTACYNGTAAKANIQLTGPDGVTYKYFLPPAEAWVALPLSGGSGAYAVAGYENIEGTSYAELFKETFTAPLENELLPFLYPNQFVDFNADTRAVAVAAEVAADVTDDLAAVEAIYHYVVDNVTYDEAKAATVTSGYLPNVDETLATGKGICFDYAALTAAMLRSQNIPAKLEIGYAGEAYHAWISVYTEERGWIDRLIEFSGAWTRMDPTFAAGSESSDAVLKYIGDGSNYNVQYSR